MSDVTRLSCYIPLAPFEKAILQHASQLPAWDNANQVPHYETLLATWSWSSSVISELRNHLNPESLESDYDGDVHESYRDCLHGLSHHQLLAHSQFRVNAFSRLNAGFLQFLLGHGIEAVDFVAAPTDLKAWSILVSMEKHGQLHFSGSFGHQRTFSIFRSIYCHQHSLQYLANQQDRLKFLDEVTEQWEVKCGPDVEQHAQRYYQSSQNHQRYLFRSKPDKSLYWPEDEARMDHKGTYTDKYLEFLLKEAYAESWIEGILENIPMLPFKDLHQVNAIELLRDGINLSIPFAEKENFVNLRWMLWKPSINSTIGTHLLHTEDEVYQYCVLKGWSFPDNLYQDRVIFAVRPLHNTEFVLNLEQFWDSWNDCCLSWDPLQQQLCLLETVPGLRFRAREKYQDRQVALCYYRNLVEAHAAGRLNDTAMQDLLGAEYYNTLFAHSLRYIPEEQIILDPQPFLGQGRNGKVYRATWHRPAAVLETSQQGEVVEVALKAIKSAGLSPKFVQEMDLTYTSVSGSAVGCIDLCGISTVPASVLNLQAFSGSAVRPNRAVVLVTKYANQGSIRDYLKSKFPTMTCARSWELLIDMLSSIANGLHTLHRRDIIHRDLHLNNILVTRTHYADQPELFSFEDSAKVADIGEGRRIVSQITTATFNASVEARDFHAPEIITLRKWSTASDVFAFGVVACKLLDLRAQLCSTEVHRNAAEIETTGTTDGDSSDEAPASITEANSVVPIVIAELIYNALARNPENRWSSREHVRKLDDLSMDFYVAREEPGRISVKWTTLDWWGVFEQAHSPDLEGGIGRQQRDASGEESSTWTLPDDTPPSEHSQ